MPILIYTAQCPHCHEKLHWGETARETRALPERCHLCHEPLSAAERARMSERAEVAMGDESFQLPAEG